MTTGQCAAPCESRLLHVLLIYRHMIPSVLLCGHCQMEYLHIQGQVEYRAAQEMSLRHSDLDWAGVVLLARCDCPYERRVSKALRLAGKQLVYVIDDDLLSVPQHLSSAWYYHLPRVRKDITAMLEMSHAIVSPSPLLLEKYANGKVAIPVEEPALFPLPYQPHDPAQPVKIGFAGSIDRTGDVEAMLGGALRRIKAEYGDRVAFEFFGAVPAFAADLGAKATPYCQSYEEYRSTLNQAGWDIGLAPMPDSPFHRHKHYNKFIEYAAAGIVGVFSDVQPYTRLHDFAEDCALFCSQEEHWYQQLKYLLDHPAEREAMRLKVSEFAAGRLSLPVCAQDLLKRLQMLPLPSGDKVRICLTLNKFPDLARRGKQKIIRMTKSAIRKILP